MRTTRVIIGLSTAAALLLAGCGTTEDPAAATDTSTSGEKITVVDARGKEVTLDGPAKRIASTEWNGTEHLISLGVMPVGVSDVKGYGQWTSAAPLDDTVKDIGNRGEPSIDTLGALDLDLVVVTDDLVEGAVEQIEQRVPVIVISGGDAADSIGAMFECLDMLAKATGKDAEAKQLRTDFDAKLAEGRAAIEDIGATGEKVAVSDSYVDAGSVKIRPYAKGALVADVLARIGLENAWPMEGDAEYGLASTDVEGLTALGDVRYWYMANDAFGDPYTEQLKGNAIWENLPFVKSGKVLRLPDSMWMFGGAKSMSQYVDAAVDALKA
jgi:ferric hydroxamate transport system substrate-binding protein